MSALLLGQLISLAIGGLVVLLGALFGGIVVRSEARRMRRRALARREDRR